jgi:hypothetical protein
MVMPVGRRGASKLGCLLSLALFVGALTYGVRIGKMYWRYYELLDDFKSSARFAQMQTDDVIRRNLQQRIDELAIPPDAKRRLLVRRTPSPPYRITIRTQYQERLDLPFGKPRYIVFKPNVETGF